MITLLDGPIKGDFTVRRAPAFIRAVCSALGKFDVLDQLDDAPSPDEDVYVYQRVEAEPVQVHLYGAKGVTGWFSMATYHHRADVDAAAQGLGGTKAWRDWCLTQV